MKAPFIQFLTIAYALAAQAANVNSVPGRVQKSGTVTRVSVIPGAALNGANTNTRKFELINKGQSGAGSTVIASVQFNAGTNLTAFDELELTLTATLANRNVVAGDVLVLVSSAVGTGIADTAGGACNVEIKRAD